MTVTIWLIGSCAFAPKICFKRPRTLTATRTSPAVNLLGPRRAARRIAANIAKLPELLRQKEI
jgi:hypothetical protein